MAESIQSVVRAMTILNTLADHMGGLSKREVSEKLDLSISTVYHLMGTLEDGGYIRSHNGKCFLGPVIPRLNHSYEKSISLNFQLERAVSSLAEITEETAYVAVWAEGRAVIHKIIEGSQAVRVGGLYVGFSGKSHQRASGKVLLAYQDEQVVQDYINTADFTPSTSRSVRTPEALRAQLRKIVKRGYAIDAGEFAEGANCVAAPVFSASGELLAALTVSSPEHRFVHDKSDLIDAVVRVAAETSRAFHYEGARRHQ